MLRRYHPDGAQPRIPVWGPVGTAQRMAQAYGLPEAIGMNDEFAFYEHAGPVHLGPFDVVPGAGRTTPSRPSASGSPPTAGRSGTPPTPGPAPAWTAWPTASTCCSPRRRSRPARTTRRTSTSPAPTAAGRPPKGGVGRLVVTHVPAWYDSAVAVAEAKAHFSGPLDLAEIGATYLV